MSSPIIAICSYICVLRSSRIGANSLELFSCSWTKLWLCIKVHFTLICNVDREVFFFTCFLKCHAISWAIKYFLGWDVSVRASSAQLFQRVPCFDLYVGLLLLLLVKEIRFRLHYVKLQIIIRNFLCKPTINCIRSLQYHSKLIFTVCSYWTYS